LPARRDALPRGFFMGFFGSVIDFPS